MIFAPINHNLSDAPRFDLMNEMKENKMPSKAMLAALKRKHDMKLIADLTKESQMMRCQIDAKTIGSYNDVDSFVKRFTTILNELSALKSKYHMI